MPKRSRSQDDSHIDVQSPAPTKIRLDNSDSSLSGNSTSILSWNVETPVPFLQLPVTKARSAANATPNVVPGSKPALLRELLRRHSFPDFVCLQEVRARHTDKEWIAALGLAVNFGVNTLAGTVGNGHTEDEPQYTMYHSLSRATRGQRHFGVVTYVRNPDAVACVREVTWDAEGRVLVMEMKAGWALVNVYALNGNEFMWRDPLGEAAPKTRNERKRDFNRLLMQECVHMQQRGLRVVLIGDFNISLTTLDCHPRLRTEYPHGLARLEFLQQFIPAVDVVDIFRELHPVMRAYSWFAKAKPQGADCARVDYALVASSLKEKMVDVTYFDNDEDRAHSDHAPLLLTMKDMSTLQDVNLPPLGVQTIDPELNVQQNH